MQQSLGVESVVVERGSLWNVFIDFICSRDRIIDRDVLRSCLSLITIIGVLYVGEWEIDGKELPRMGSDGTIKIVLLCLTYTDTCVLIS